MFRKLANLLPLILILNSCSVVDRAANRTQQLVDHSFQKLSDLKTEILTEMDQKFQVMVPRATSEIGDRLDATLDGFLNSDVVAFVIVSATVLLTLVVIVTLLLLYNTARSWWKRLMRRSTTSPVDISQK